MEVGDDAQIDGVARDERTIIKASTMTQEKLDGGVDDLFAVFVQVGREFPLDFAKAVQDNLPFAEREVQGLTQLIGEERILISMLPPNLVPRRKSGICRCGTYMRIKKAIKTAARE